MQIFIHYDNNTSIALEAVGPGTAVGFVLDAAPGKLLSSEQHQAGVRVEKIEITDLPEST